MNNNYKKDIPEYDNGENSEKLIKKEFPDGITMLDLASVWRRLFAQLIDQILGVFFIVVVVFLFGHSSALLGFLIYFLYVTLNDALPNGQSYGKYLMKIKVINEKNGKPCKLLESFSRNITTLIPVINLIDALMIFNKRKQRLGDVFADTLVVNLLAKTKLNAYQL